MIVTLDGFGTIEGAVNKPELEIDPQVLPLQPCPDSDHVTAVLEEPVTVAANCFVPLTGTVAEDGEMLTETAPWEPR